MVSEWNYLLFLLKYCILETSIAVMFIVPVNYLSFSWICYWSLTMKRILSYILGVAKAKICSRNILINKWRRITLSQRIIKLREVLCIGITFTSYFFFFLFFFYHSINFLLPNTFMFVSFDQHTKWYWYCYAIFTSFLRFCWVWSFRWTLSIEFLLTYIIFIWFFTISKISSL